ncbi:MAG TPA: helix-turn-helix transcriptional regulator [Haloplasmataceae bacterium]
MISEENLKKTISKNLIRYRKMNNLTQKELAIEINYSDKAISKWERGESLPDIYVLSLLAEFYHTSICNLITDQQTPEKRRLHRIEKLISLLSAMVVWSIASIVFLYLNINKFDVTRPWLVFIYALPLSCVVLLFFVNKWKSLLYSFITSSFFIWTLALSIHLTLYPKISNMWMIYIAIFPLQVILAIWFILKIKHQKE